jgi:hypothetical protein
VRLRDFRNIILLTALSMVLLTAALPAAVAAFPGAIPMCFNPSVTAAAGARGFRVCPSGEQQSPGPGDILLAGGFVPGLTNWTASARSWPTP